MRNGLQVSRVALALMLVVTAAGRVAAQGRVGGTVRSETGQPIKGATITARAGAPDVQQPDSFTSSTDDKGRFAMVGLPRGEWSFTVQAPGYMPEGGTVNIRAIAPNPPFVFTLRKAAVVPSVLGSLESKDLQAQLTVADRLYNGQRWDDAIAAYRTILEKAPGLSFINLQIAAAYRKKKDFDSAIGVYNVLLKTDPTNNRAAVALAMANVEKGDLDAAEKTLEVAGQTAGATRDVFYSLGDVKLARQKPDEAAKAYQRASDLDATWGKPVFALGRLAMSRNDKPGAMKYFERVVDVDPMSPEAALAKAAIEQLKTP
jgi:tetratricopeptide (TPR) repeat protein